MLPKGHNRVNARHPQPGGICDRCGFRFPLAMLVWQYEWYGPRLQNTRFRVCRMCLDQPFEHHRPLILPPDPEPVLNPRPRLNSPEVAAVPHWNQINVNWSETPWDWGAGEIPDE